MEDDPKNDELLSSTNILEIVRQRNHKLLRVALLKDVDSSQINKEDQFSGTPLDLAVCIGDLEATTLLLDHGALPDICHNSIHWHSDSNYRQKDTIDLESLYNYNSIPDLYVTRCIWWNNTLFRAIECGDRDIIKLLIDKCCDPDATLELNNSYLITYNCWYKVVERNDLSMFEFLMGCTGREVGDNDWSQLMLLTACATGSNGTVLYLLDKGVPIDTPDLYGLKGVFRALISNHFDTFMRLVDRGANLHLKDANGLSLLHLAVHLSMSPSLLNPAMTYGILRLLLDRGLDVNTCDIFNRTPLHHAARWNLPILDLLIEYGADINVVDKEGKTPILTAYKFNSTKCIVSLLQKKHLTLPKPDSKGHIFLHKLIIDDEINCFIDLMARPEIDINARDKNNMTPLHHVFMNDRDYYDIFIDLGADTGAILDCKHKVVEKREIILYLERIRIIRSVADFPSDKNIDALLKDNTFLKNSVIEEYTLKYKEIIETMKNTKLLGRLTYFDFLHAKRRACIAVAKRPEMREIFSKHTHKFYDFSYMLAKSFIYGLRPFTKVESDAIEFSEDNFNILFKGFLPNLVIHQIKKYIEIEDMVTLHKVVTTER